jgi:hypothetical protein
VLELRVVHGGVAPALTEAPGVRLGGFFVPYDRRVAKYDAEQLRKLTAEGKAMPGGRYPIDDEEDLHNAVRAVGRGKGSHAAIRAHIAKQAKRLHATEALPTSWSLESGHLDAFHDLGDFLQDVDDEERLAAYQAWDALAERMAREDGLDAIGTWGADLHGIGLAKPSAARLTEYWTHGEGAAKVRWGTHDSMKRCIRHLTGKVASPGGLCADYHKIATGEWPTEHGKKGIPS